MELVINTILTIALVTATIVMCVHTVRKSIKEKRVLMAIIGLKTPDSFGFIYDYKNTDEITKVRKTLTDREYIHADIKDEKGNIIKSANHAELTVSQKNYLKDANNCYSIYYEPPSLEDAKIAGGSIVINLIPRENSGDGICVFKNLTRVRIRNYGAPMAYLYIDECLIDYGNNKLHKLVNNKKTPIPLHIDSNEDGYINLSEVTMNFKDALCDIKKIDNTKDATEIEYTKDFFYYDKITLKLTATSAYGINTTFRVVLAQTGETLSFLTNPKTKKLMP